MKGYNRQPAAVTLHSFTQTFMLLKAARQVSDWPVLSQRVLEHLYAGVLISPGDTCSRSYTPRNPSNRLQAPRSSIGDLPGRIQIRGTADACSTDPGACSIKIDAFPLQRGAFLPGH